MDNKIENEISGIIVDRAFFIHTTLGPGLLESAYEKVLAKELTNAGLKVVRQYPVPMIWKGEQLGRAYIADMLVDDKVIVEIKSASAMNSVFRKQLYTYLRLADLKLGLLINFNAELIKDGIKRVVNGL